jgi:hypothetical protein
VLNFTRERYMRERRLVAQLKPQTRQREVKPIKKLVFDIETKSDGIFELNRVWLGGAVYDGENYIFCETAKDLWDTLNDKCYAGYRLYAHNGSHFDFLHLLPYIKSEKCRAIVRGGRVWIFWGDKRCMVDSAATIPVSVKTAAEKLGCNYQKTEMDYKNIHKKKWKPYLENDCKTEYEVLDKYETQIENLGGQLKLTMASTAMDIFRHQYMRHTLKCEPAMESIEREALYGGRTEIIRKGGFCSDWRMYDINSSYSKSALRVDIPVSFNRNQKTPPEKGVPYIARVLVDIPKCRIPSLPFRDGMGKTIYPYGTWEGVYTGIEIEHTRELFGKKSIKIKECYVYDGAPVFDLWVDSLYREKQKGSFAAKLTMNSLFGRFALRRDAREILIGVTAKDYFLLCKKHGQMNIVPIDEKYGIYDVPCADNAFRSPFIFGWITADARVRLHRAMWDNEKTALVDTDSLINEGHTIIDEGENVGQWKDETSKELPEKRFYEGYAPKLYRYGKKCRAKGFHLKKTADNYDMEEFEGLIKDKKMWQERTLGFREHLNKHENKFTLTGSLKKINLLNEKRRFFADGESEPYEVKNGKIN